MATRLEPVKHRRMDFASVFRTVKRGPWPIIFLLPILVFGIFGPLIYPHDPTAMNLDIALQPPAWMDEGDPSYFLGTDKLGRDVLSRLIEGARASLIVSVVGVAFAGLIGVTLGMLAGYFGGTFDNLVMRMVDTWMSMPVMLFMILLAALVGGGGLHTIIISIGVIFWTGYSRVVRGETLSIMQREYVAMARITGCNNFRVLVKHILPNLINTVVVMATLQLGMAIMVEASITFLGMGIQPPNTAWGLIVAEGRTYMSTAWWVPTFGGLAIMITILGANLMGDWLRDWLDPRLRQIL